VARFEAVRDEQYRRSGTGQVTAHGGEVLAQAAARRHVLTRRLLSGR
jgi:hypothetical protein